MRRAAVFLDRDGTIIRDTDYIARPEDVELLPGAASAIRRLNDAGIPVVVVTNQSGIARGYYGEREYHLVHARVDELLRESGARLEGHFMCPHHPDITGPCECRKPGTLLFRRAAEQLGLDLPRSWYVGDRHRDVAPAEESGGSGMLIAGPNTPPEEVRQAAGRFEVVESLEGAVERILASRDQK